MKGLSEEDLFDALSNTSNNVYLFECNMKTGISKWSDNAVAYFGLPDGYESHTLDLWIEHIHPEDRQGYLADINAVFSGESDKHKYQYRASNSYGEYIWMECIGNVIYDDDGQHGFFVGMMTRLDNQSKYDPVTKCQSIQQFYQQNITETCSFLLIGMDEFRKVINTLGYAAGNQILIALAKIIRADKRTICSYRMTGDEFLLVLPKQKAEDLKTFFYQILYRFQNKCISYGIWKKLSFSGGAICYDPSENNKENAIRQLEHSMEHAKSIGRGTFVSFSHVIEEKHTRIHKIKQALAKAIEHDYEGFELYYQPIMSAKTECIYAVEALLRFQTKDLGRISPGEFIPILEETGEIQSVGMWVMKEAIKQKSKWQESFPDLVIGFNVSYLQLYTYDFVDSLIDTIHEYQVNPKHIVIELTESCKVEYPGSLAAMLTKVSQIGVALALDDFGMEQSSFTLVRDLPVSCIKIEHSFVSNLTQLDERQKNINLAIVSSVNYLCKQLGIKVTVEGIEKKEIHEKMKEMKVDFLQGFYYSYPISVDEFEMCYLKGDNNEIQGEST